MEFTCMDTLIYMHTVLECRQILAPVNRKPQQQRGMNTASLTYDQIDGLTEVWTNVYCADARGHVFNSPLAWTDYEFEFEGVGGGTRESVS